MRKIVVIVLGILCFASAALADPCRINDRPHEEPKCSVLYTGELLMQSPVTKRWNECDADDLHIETDCATGAWLRAVRCQNAVAPLGVVTMKQMSEPGNRQKPTAKRKEQSPPIEDAAMPPGSLTEVDPEHYYWQEITGDYKAGPRPSGDWRDWCREHPKKCGGIGGLLVGLAVGLLAGGDGDSRAVAVVNERPNCEDSHGCGH